MDVLEAAWAFLLGEDVSLSLEGDTFDNDFFVVVLFLDFLGDMVREDGGRKQGVKVEPLFGSHHVTVFIDQIPTPEKAKGQLLYRRNVIV